MQASNVTVQFLAQHGFTELEQVIDETQINQLIEQLQNETEQHSVAVGEGVNFVNIVVYENYIAAYFSEYVKDENGVECEDDIDLFCCSIFSK